MNKDQVITDLRQHKIARFFKNLTVLISGIQIWILWEDFFWHVKNESRLRAFSLSLKLREQAPNSVWNSNLCDCQTKVNEPHLSEVLCSIPYCMWVCTFDCLVTGCVASMWLNFHVKCKCALNGSSTKGKCRTADRVVSEIEK